MATYSILADYSSWPVLDAFKIKSILFVSHFPAQLCMLLNIPVGLLRALCNFAFPDS